MRSKATDPKEYDVVFNTCDDVEEILEAMGSVSKEMFDEILVDNEDTIEKEEEEYYKQNDPVKKCQFQYNK